MKILILLLLLALFALAASSKYVLDVKRISSTDAALTCANGGDPTGTKVGDTLIISCGK